MPIRPPPLPGGAVEARLRVIVEHFQWTGVGRSEQERLACWGQVLGVRRQWLERTKSYRRCLLFTLYQERPKDPTLEVHWIGEAERAGVISGIIYKTGCGLDTISLSLKRLQLTIRPNEVTCLLCRFKAMK